MTEELNKLLNSRVLTKQTINNYTNIYNKIRAITQKDINEVSNELLLEVIEVISNGKINNKLVYINVPIIIKQLYNKDIWLLDKTRNELSNERDKLSKVKAIEKDNELPDYEVVKKYVNDLSKGEDHVKFIVNFLIFNYAVRNKDINVFITEPAYKKKYDNFNSNNNFFVVKKTEIEWIRNDYKTIQSHLQQKHIIKSPKVLRAVKAIIDKRAEKGLEPINFWLLNGLSFDNKLEDTSKVSRYLFKHNDKNLTEGDYFKMNIKYLQTQPNSYTKIMELGSIRGTNGETIEKYYNVSK